MTVNNPRQLTAVDGDDETTNYCLSKTGLLSPMQLPPEADCFKCSLLCEIKFKYPKTTNWQINATSIMYNAAKTMGDIPSANDTSNRRLLRWYVSQTDGLVREDIEYNGKFYQLEFIEFYTPALHALPKVETNKDAPMKRSQYDAEMVMVHRSLDSKGAEGKPNGGTNWLNVSVPIHSMYTYSLSQDFFAQMIQPVCQEGMNVEDDRVGGLAQGTIVTVIGLEGRDVPNATIQPVSMTGLTGVGNYSGVITKHYLPSRVNLIGQPPSKTKYPGVLITELLKDNRNIQSKLAPLSKPPEKGNDYDSTIKALKGVIVSYKPGPTPTDSTYACTIESYVYDRTFDQQQDTTPYYLVNYDATSKFVKASQVKPIDYTAQCPWSAPQPNSDGDAFGSYYTMSTSIGPTIPVQTTSRDQTCQPGLPSASTYGNSCQSLTVSTNWNPYQGLPYEKSLYIYGGMFPYAPGLYDEADTVTWVVMKNPVPMHTAEYERLLALIKPASVKLGSRINAEIAGQGFLMNMGDRYQPADRAGRNVYYNDGGLIQNDDDQEKFYIKCAKAHDAEQQESVAKYIASGATDADGRAEDLAAIGAQYTPIEYQASTLSFYKPPQSPVSTILVSFILSFLLFAMFAVFYYNRVSVKADGSGGEKRGSRWYTNMLFAFVCVCVFVMYGLSFVSVSKLGAGVLVWGGIGAGALYLWNKLGGWLLSDEESAWRRYLYYGGYGALSLYLLCLTMVPTFFYNPYVTYDRSFYYINGDVDSFDDQDDITVFIGTRPALDIEFAGYALQYRNEYTLSQQYAGSTKMGKAKVPINAKSLNLAKRPTATDAAPSSAVQDPNMQFYSISSNFWSPLSTQLLIRLTDTDTIQAGGSAKGATGGDDDDTDDDDDVHYENNMAKLRVQRVNLKLTQDILLAYDARMKTDNTHPFAAFVQACTTILQGTSTAQAQTPDQVRSALAEHYPQLYAYLNRQPIDFGVTDAEILALAAASATGDDGAGAA
jgi:hypothetical protein